MARVDLRNCLVYILDGLTGTAAVAQTAAPAAGDSTVTLGTVSVNTSDGSLPVGARLEVAGETTPIPHVVTAVTKGGTTETPTYACTISPALGAGTYAVDAAITFLSQQLEVKIGEGNITYTEKSDYTYLLDRDNLDTVKEGKDVPLDIKWDSVYEFITTGTSEEITPMDALKGINGASEWITYSKDPCEPYAVAIEVQQVPPCSTAESESTLFPDFRSEQREVNFKDATISINGKCNVTQPIVTRLGS